MSILSLFKMLARLTGLPPPRWRVPYPIALAAAYVSEFIADVYTHRRPAATITGVKLTRRRMHFDPRRSLAELELRPRLMAESVAETVAWFRDDRMARLTSSRGMNSLFLLLRPGFR